MLDHLQAEYPEIILASGSTARADILGSAGIRFRQVPAPAIDEEVERKRCAKGTPPGEVALHLAKLKAGTVFQNAPDAVVIGGDQVLSVGDDILRKPADLKEAREQLKRLRGRVHELHTAAVVLSKSRSAEFTDVASMRMRDFSDKFIDCYLEMCGEGVLNSVGAYHIEGLGVHLFSEIKGDYYTILGMPSLPVLEELRRLSMICK
jgi:septum formation protein